MDDLSIMLSNQRNYNNLSYNINLIINNLNSAIEKLEIPSEKIDNYYNIDSVSIDEGKLKTVRQNLINKRDYLRSIVLVEINRELDELNNNIESMG